MASIRERNGKFCVIYHYMDADGKRRQKWETYKTRGEANWRKKAVEFKENQGAFVVSQCTRLKDLLGEYVELYGKDKWALSTYARSNALIRNYILPLIGEETLADINTRFLEKYYQKLQTTPAVITRKDGQVKKDTCVGTSTIRDIHKLLRSCFKQAVKWELMEKNPAEYATVPKHKATPRQIWTADTVMQALNVCDDPQLKLALNLAFAASLRIGELLGLTWDCVDISKEAVDENRAYIQINKELQRVSKTAMKELDQKDILLVFPQESVRCTTVRVLKTPKTESSIRKVFLPKSVALMLREQKASQDEIKAMIGDEYKDYNLVMATAFGMPEEGSSIRKKLKKLIKENDLPDVVFHSMRHTSVTYKLKLNGGDIKAVQGDSGHAQVNMVTDVYSHIIDEDRRRNAALFEAAFYGKKNLDPQMRPADKSEAEKLPDDVDAELIAKVLANPEMKALLMSLAKTVQ